MLRRTLDQRIEIAVEIEPGLPPCRADAGQLDASLLNIAINARDAMPEGGRLGFSAQRGSALPAGLAADLEAGREYVAIAVTDSGTGMPEHIRERAFEPFFTTKEAGRGTGLGLSTVYGFARQSKGGVTLDSTPGAGTAVTLYIPAYAAEAANEDADASAGEALPPGLRVLLVEDEPEVREVAATFLAALECATTSCPDAEQALAALTESGDFDLLLSDIALGPGMRGTELARRALVHSPELAVLLVSGFASDQLGADASFEGAPWEVLRKPYSRQELARAIARAIAAVR
jgi:CheY-like chemotaxis protein